MLSRLDIVAVLHPQWEWIQNLCLDANDMENKERGRLRMPMEYYRIDRKIELHTYINVTNSMQSVNKAEVEWCNMLIGFKSILASCGEYFPS